MASLQKVVVVLLIITLVLSAVSVAFNFMIYKMKSDNVEVDARPSSNAGNIGFIVESSNEPGEQNG